MGESENSHQRTINILSWELAVAVCAAPLFWIIWSRLHPITTNLGWPLDDPKTFLILAVTYPILEEIVFRGLIQDALKNLLPAKHLGPLSLPNLATSLLFGGLHALLRSGITGIMVFWPSLIFGYFKERSGGLGVPIGLHIFYNSGFFLLFYR